MSIGRWAGWAGAIAIAWTCQSVAAAPPLQLRFVAQPWPPFIHLDNGKLTGPFVDIVHAACETMHAQCTIELFPWRRALQMTTEGEADGLLAILDLPERRQVFHMSPALIRTAYVLYAQQDSTLHDPTPAMLAGYTVAAFGPSGTSSVAARLAQATPNARLQVEIDNDTALRKLRMGRYSNKAVVLINEDLGIWLMRREGDAGLRQVGEVQKITYHLGLSRKRLAPAVAERLITTLEEMVRSGTVHSIAARYGMHGVQ